MYLRLKVWMDNKGLKSSQLADFIGVNRSTVSHVLSGRNKPSIDFLHKLLEKYPYLNSNWLISGVGSMDLNNSCSSKITEKKINKVIVFYDDDSYEEIIK